MPSCYEWCPEEKCDKCKWYEKFEEELKMEKYDVYEIVLGEDDKIIVSNVTEEEAEKIVAENPKLRTMIPTIINGA